MEPDLSKSVKMFPALILSGVQYVLLMVWKGTLRSIFLRRVNNSTICLLTLGSLIFMVDLQN